MSETKYLLPQRVLWIAAGVLCVLSAVSFFIGDEPVLKMILKSKHPWPRGLPAMATAQLGKAWAILWLVAVYVWRAGFTRHAAAALLSLVMVLGVCGPIKVMVSRPRPETVISGQAEIKSPTSSSCHSFPSGDTATTFAAAAVCIGLLSRPQLAVAFAAAGFVGLHRMMLIRHYLSDVLAGAAIGIVCGILAMEIVRRRLPEKPFKENIKTVKIIGLICAILLVPLSCLEKFYPLVTFLQIYGIPAIIIVGVDIIRQRREANSRRVD